jgi:Tfp pilus assembly protein PilO
MKTKLLVIMILSIILITFAGCGVSQSDYNKALEDKLTIENRVKELETINAIQLTQINELTELLSEVKLPTYFPNRTAIVNWLKTTPKLGVSKDSEQWLQFALYYQQKALEIGYIISVSYSINSDGNITVTCDIVTQDGWLYYFDPDDCKLEDTYLRVEMVETKDLENTYQITY